MNRMWEWLLGISRADFAGADGWSLRLTGMPSSAVAMLGLLALFALLAWLTVRCYLREGGIPRRVKLGLALPRLAVLGLVFLVLLQPTLMVRFAKVRSGTVAVLLDDTLSMRWRDRYDDSRRAALAAALRLDEERLAGEARPTRSEAVRQALGRSGGLLDRLAADHPVSLYRFGETGTDATSYIQSLGEWQRGDSTAEARRALDAMQADGRYTDLGRAVREVFRRLEGGRTAAIVVISDGRNTALEKARLSGVAQLAAQRKTPLFAVAVGDPAPPCNVAVAQLLAPREARAGSKLALTALISYRSLPRTTTQVELWRSRAGQDDWEDTGVRGEVTLGGEPAAAPTPQSSQAADGLQEVALVTDAPAVGVYSYQARILPPPGDSIPSDNEASAIVRVTDQKVKVLLVSGGASYEFQHLRGFLLRSSEHYAVTAWQQTADDRFNQDASLGMKRSSLPTSLQDLAGYDLVVLCDPRHTPGSFDENFLEALDQFVAKHQGGLCYIAGNKTSPRALAGRGALEPLGGLLPVVLAADDAGELRADQRKTWRLELTAEGQAHPTLRLATENTENLGVWRKLPGVYRSQRVTRLKPAAAALAIRPEPGRDRQDPGEPFVAVQYYGRGRVLYLGFEGTWRWRPLDDAAHYERFWSGAMEFLAAGRVEKNRIVVTTAGEIFDAGREIEVRVEAQNRDLNPLEAKGLVVEMRPRDGGEPIRQTLRRERPGTFAGAIRAERVGLHELTVKSDDTGAADWTADEVSTRLVRVRLPQAEFQRPEADIDALRELVGGDARLVRLDEIDSLPAKILPDRVSIPSESPHPLWSTPLMLIAFGLLLLSEWTLRKLYKMM